MSTEALTLDDLATRLEGCRRNGELVLAGSTLALPEVGDLLGAVGLSELALEDAPIHRTADSVSVAGKASLFGFPDVDGSATFGVEAGVLSVALNAAFPDGARLRLLGLPWASLGNLALALNVTGPSLLVPVVSGVLSGEVELEGLPEPVPVTLTPVFGRADWLLRATDIPLPGPSAVAGLLGLDDAGQLMPPKLDELDGFSIVELLCRFDPVGWTVRSLGATIAAPGKEWELASGLPKLRELSLSLGVEFAGAEDGDYFPDTDELDVAAPSNGAVESVTASLAATLTLAKLDLPVRITRETDGWRMGILGAHGFPSLGELVSLVADTAAAEALPAGLRELRMDSASLELALGSGDPTLRSIFFSTRLADHWPIVEDHLALEHVALELFVDRAGGDTSGFFTGAIRLGDVELPVAVQKPGGSAPWTLRLGSDVTPTLAGLSSLAGVVGGGDVGTHLPTGFGDSAVSLEDLSMAFDPATHSVTQIAVEVRSAGPWSLPELTDFDVRDLLLKLRVAWPGDSTRREVTGTIGGTVDLAGAPVTITASKPSGEAPWKLEGALAAGSTLSLSALTRRMLPGGTPLPDDVPDLALSTLALEVTPDTGALGLKAGSAGPWSLPVGFAGLQVSDLHLNLQRTASGADLTGAVGGKLSVAGALVTVEYTLPGDLVLAGHFDSLQLSRLVADLVGADLVEALPMPAAFKQLELQDVDVSLAPGRGRFLASARVPGFDTAAFLLQKSSAGGWGFALALAPAASWRLSELSEGLQALDGLSFGSTVLIISTADDDAAIGELPVVRDRLKTAGAALSVGHGLTLLADLSLAGTGADRLLDMTTLRVRATVGESLSSLMLEAEVGGPFPLGENVVLRELDFRLVAGAADFELGLIGQIEVALDSGNKLTFTGGLAVTPNGASCKVTMKGTWNEPFGAKGVSVSDLALELGTSFEGVPAIALAGRTAIGDFHGAVAVKFDSEDLSQSMVAVSFDSLKLADVLTSLCHEVFHDAIPPEIIQTVFDISFKDVVIQVVPRDTTIGELEFKRGTRLNARMFFWGLEADAHVEIDYETGLVVDGKVDPIVLADVFSLKGAGGRPKPSLHLEVAPNKVPTVDVEGEISLLGLTSETQLSLSDTGFSFETSGSLFGLFTCTLKARGGHLADTNGFLVEATMENDLFAYLREHATAALQEAAKSVDESLASAENDVRAAEAKVASFDQDIAARRQTIQAEREETRRSLNTSRTAVARAKQQLVADLNRQIDELSTAIRADRARDTQRLVDAQRDVQKAQGDVDSILAEINRVRTVIQGERDLATRRMVDAQASVDAAQRNVDTILSKIREQEAWWNRLPDADWPWKESKARAGVWYYPMIGGMYAAYGTATAAVQTGWGVLEGIKAGAQFTPIEADPRIAGLYTAYGTATAALEAASGVVEGVKGVLNLPPIELDPRLVALYGTRTIAQSELELAIAALSVTQSGLDALPIDLDPAIVALTAARETELAVLKAAEGLLEATRVTLGAGFEVSEHIVRYGLGGLIDVRKASFAAGLDAVHGGEVRLSVDLEFLGQPQHVEFDFDFNNLASGVESLVKELLAA